MQHISASLLSFQPSQIFEAVIPYQRLVKVVAAVALAILCFAYGYYLRPPSPEEILNKAEARPEIVALKGAKTPQELREFSLIVPPTKPESLAYGPFLNSDVANLILANVPFNTVLALRLVNRSWYYISNPRHIECISVRNLLIGDLIRGVKEKHFNGVVQNVFFNKKEKRIITFRSLKIPDPNLLFFCSIILTSRGSSIFNLEEKEIRIVNIPNVEFLIADDLSPDEEKTAYQAIKEIALATAICKWRPSPAPDNAAAI